MENNFEHLNRLILSVIKKNEELIKILDEAISSKKQVKNNIFITKQLSRKILTNYLSNHQN